MENVNCSLVKIASISLMFSASITTIDIGTDFGFFFFKILSRY